VSVETDEEIAAIKSVLDALTPLPVDVRQNVLDYVVKRLQISRSEVDLSHSDRGTPPPGDTGTSGAKDLPPLSAIHIKDFKTQKSPNSASEMSAIVAYYLANLAPQSERKDRITTKEIDTYFKIAGFPLPKIMDMTLVNAKASGYLDSIGNGEYRLNAVGHNLVAHSLPRGAGATRPQRRSPAKRSRTTAKKR
jgi:hypothetical protein